MTVSVKPCILQDDCQRLLEWIKHIRKSQGLVEMDAVSQIQEINEKSTLAIAFNGKGQVVTIILYKFTCIVEVLMSKLLLSKHITIQFNKINTCCSHNLLLFLIKFIIFVSPAYMQGGT